MKAIVNVNKGSKYARLNGYTFEVKALLTKLVALDIDGTTAEFEHSEVYIVDIVAEMQNAEQEFMGRRKGDYRNLQEYAKHIDKYNLDQYSSL